MGRWACAERTELARGEPQGRKGEAKGEGRKGVEKKIPKRVRGGGQGGAGEGSPGLKGETPSWTLTQHSSNRPRPSFKAINFLHCFLQAFFAHQIDFQCTLGSFVAPSTPF